MADQVRTPADPDATDQATAPLTGHQNIARDVENEDGSLRARHTTTVITDPEADNAVQTPDPDENPLANATDPGTF